MTTEKRKCYCRIDDNGVGHYCPEHYPLMNLSKEAEKLEAEPKELNLSRFIPMIQKGENNPADSRQLLQALYLGYQEACKNSQAVLAFKKELMKIIEELPQVGNVQNGFLIGEALISQKDVLKAIQSGVKSK